MLLEPKLKAKTTEILYFLIISNPVISFFGIVLDDK